MHFKRLKINNFGPFLGEHEINLETNNEVQKVILIGAMNGSGKTTLHEALQIVLFGKLSAPAKRFRKGGYETFLSTFMNKHTTRELGASIELEFSFTEDGEQLEDWMESKIAQSEQSIVAVVKAFMYDEVEGENGGMDKLDYGDLVIGN